LPEHCKALFVHVPWQDATPPSATHVELMQATAIPQFPFWSQVCRPCGEHWVDPGTHWPTHFPPTHAELPQATGAP
jgi:hypothetical protein